MAPVHRPYAVPRTGWRQAGHVVRPYPPEVSRREDPHRMNMPTRYCSTGSLLKMVWGARENKFYTMRKMKAIFLSSLLLTGSVLFLAQMDLSAQSSKKCVRIISGQEEKIFGKTLCICVDGGWDCFCVVECDRKK